MIAFDAATHTYTGAHGERFPSVTQVLAPLIDFSMVPAATIEYARKLGTAVHKATELDDAGDLDESSVSPILVPYLDAWRNAVRDMEIEIVAYEQMVFHPAYKYAGMLDRRARIKGESAIIDIKTGGLFPSYGPQTAAYKSAVEAETGEKIKRRYTITLKDDGKYNLEMMNSADDWPAFLSCLTLWRFKKKHGI
jgi:hypothetical protein